MTPLRRWCVVALGVLLVVGVPAGLQALPARDSDVTAAALLQQVRDAEGAGWSGYVETEGTLQLPDADRFSDVGALFGESTRMRVWWRDADHWRVDRLLVAGETDLVHRGDRTTEWDYERNEATISRDPDIRLPRTSDLVPAQVAARFLRGVTEAERIPAERIAGTSAPGLRLRPDSDLSSIDYVALWADPDTGVPLRVEVYGAAAAPAFTSTVRDFDGSRPSRADTGFEPAPGAEVRFEDVLDIADAANQYAPIVPPATAAGLPQSGSTDGAVGVYGEGMTQVIAIPLRDREADALRDQLRVTPGVDQTDERSVVSVGPLGVILTGGEGDGGFLLTGFLTRAALEQAAQDVLDGFRYEDRR